eukprot:2151709-Alexandrium_andersonii.AAC.1
MPALPAPPSSSSAASSSDRVDDDASLAIGAKNNESHSKVKFFRTSGRKELADISDSPPQPPPTKKHNKCRGL